MTEQLRTKYVELFKRKLKASGVVPGGATTFVLDFGTPPAGLYWMVERIFTRTSSAGNPVAFVLVGPQADIADYGAGMDYIVAAKNDGRGEQPPILVQPGEKFCLRYESIAAGDAVVGQLQLSVCMPVDAHIPLDVPDVEELEAMVDVTE